MTLEKNFKNPEKTDLILFCDIIKSDNHCKKNKFVNGYHEINHFISFYNVTKENFTYYIFFENF